MSLWSRISNTVFGERLNREIDEELQSHIEEAIASGRDPKEARRAFGCALRAREASHSIRVVGWLESLLSDISFGWRQLCRNKVTSASAVLSLALGIGSCVAAFRLIDALLWRPLPISGSSRLYFLSRKLTGLDGKPIDDRYWATRASLPPQTAKPIQAPPVGVTWPSATARPRPHAPLTLVPPLRSRDSAPPAKSGPYLLAIGPKQSASARSRPDAGYRG